MQDHRNGGVPTEPPPPDSLDVDAQRTVLLVLVVCAPDEGDRLQELIDRLKLPAHSVEPAVIALELAGLAERHGDLVRASVAAHYFEYLWAVRP